MEMLEKRLLATSSPAPDAVHPSATCYGLMIAVDIPAKAATRLHLVHLICPFT